MLVCRHLGTIQSQPDLEAFWREKCENAYFHFSGRSLRNLSTTRQPQSANLNPGVKLLRVVGWLKATGEAFQVKVRA
jgi:hypothetical protein